MKKVFSKFLMLAIILGTILSVPIESFADYDDCKARRKPIHKSACTKEYRTRTIYFGEGKDYHNRDKFKIHSLDLDGEFTVTGDFAIVDPKTIKIYDPSPVDNWDTGSNSDSGTNSKRNINNNYNYLSYGRPEMRDYRLFKKYKTIIEDDGKEIETSRGLISNGDPNHISITSRIDFYYKGIRFGYGYYGIERNMEIYNNELLQEENCIYCSREINASFVLGSFFSDENIGTPTLIPERIVAEEGYISIHYKLGPGYKPSSEKTSYKIINQTTGQSWEDESTTKLTETEIYNKIKNSYAVNKNFVKVSFLKDTSFVPTTSVKERWIYTYREIPKKYSNVLLNTKTKNRETVIHPNLLTESEIRSRLSSKYPNKDILLMSRFRDKFFNETPEIKAQYIYPFELKDKVTESNYKLVAKNEDGSIYRTLFLKYNGKDFSITPEITNYINNNKTLLVPYSTQEIEKIEGGDRFIKYPNPISEGGKTNVVGKVELTTFRKKNYKIVIENESGTVLNSKIYPYLKSIQGRIRQAKEFEQENQQLLNNNNFEVSSDLRVVEYPSPRSEQGYNNIIGEMKIVLIAKENTYNINLYFNNVKVGSTVVRSKSSIPSLSGDPLKGMFSTELEDLRRNSGKVIRSEDYESISASETGERVYDVNAYYSRTETPPPPTPPTPPITLNNPIYGLQIDDTEGVEYKGKMPANNPVRGDMVLSEVDRILRSNGVTKYKIKDTASFRKSGSTWAVNPEPPNGKRAYDYGGTSDEKLRGIIKILVDTNTQPPTPPTPPEKEYIKTIYTNRDRQKSNYDFVKYYEYVPSRLESQWVRMYENDLLGVKPSEYRSVRVFTKPIKTPSTPIREDGKKVTRTRVVEFLFEGQTVQNDFKVFWDFGSKGNISSKISESEFNSAFAMNDSNIETYFRGLLKLNILKTGKNIKESDLILRNITKNRVSSGTSIITIYYDLRVAPTSCPTGQRLHPERKRCEPICSIGEIYNVEENKCYALDNPSSEFDYPNPDNPEINKSYPEPSRDFAINKNVCSLTAREKDFVEVRYLNPFDNIYTGGEITGRAVSTSFISLTKDLEPHEERAFDSTKSQDEKVEWTDNFKSYYKEIKNLNENNFKVFGYIEDSLKPKKVKNYIFEDVREVERYKDKRMTVKKVAQNLPFEKKWGVTKETKAVTFKNESKTMAILKARMPDMTYGHKTKIYFKNKNSSGACDSGFAWSTEFSKCVKIERTALKTNLALTKVPYKIEVRYRAYLNAVQPKMVSPYFTSKSSNVIKAGYGFAVVSPSVSLRTDYDKPVEIQARVARKAMSDTSSSVCSLSEELKAVDTETFCMPVHGVYDVNRNKIVPNASCYSDTGKWNEFQTPRNANYFKPTTTKTGKKIKPKQTVGLHFIDPDQRDGGYKVYVQFSGSGLPDNPYMTKEMTLQIKGSMFDDSFTVSK